MNGETIEHPRDGSPMILVPEGPFIMGLPESDFLAEDHEKPQRQVYLSGYWIDVFPVTNARFGRFMMAGGYGDASWWSKEGWAWKCQNDITRPLQWEKKGWDGPDQPVAGVSWHEADAYARWVGRRLPTDAEWEKAARGTDGRRYPWGNDWPTSKLANFNMFVDRTTPVGLYPEGKSPYGCFDMAGNVNNWVRDWYVSNVGRLGVDLSLLRDPHVDDQVRQRLGPQAITDKIDRGGGFATPLEYHEVLGCTRKVHWPPEAREAWNGFRTAMDGGKK
jgi:formylglycine-generating enzyme required for sulfatase activity